jgi:1,4-alpha-glucan branching enzyme
MTPVERKGFMVGVPFEGTYTKLLDSAKECYGGMGSGVPDKIKAVKGLCDYKDYSITFDLPPYGAEVFLFQNPSAAKEAKNSSKTSVKADAKPAAKAKKATKTNKKK